MERSKYPYIVVETPHPTLSSMIIERVYERIQKELSSLSVVHCPHPTHNSSQLTIDYHSKKFCDNPRSIGPRLPIIFDAITRFGMQRSLRELLDVGPVLSNYSSYSSFTREVTKIHDCLDHSSLFSFTRILDQRVLPVLDPNIIIVVKLLPGIAQKLISDNNTHNLKKLNYIYDDSFFEIKLKRAYDIADSLFFQSIIVIDCLTENQKNISINMIVDKIVTYLCKKTDSLLFEESYMDRVTSSPTPLNKFKALYMSLNLEGTVTHEELFVPYRNIIDQCEEAIESIVYNV